MEEEKKEEEDEKKEEEEEEEGGARVVREILLLSLDNCAGCLKRYGFACKCHRGERDAVVDSGGALVERCSSLSFCLGVYRGVLRRA